MRVKSRKPPAEYLITSLRVTPSKSLADTLLAALSALGLPAEGAAPAETETDAAALKDVDDALKQLSDLLGMVRDPLTFAIGHLEYGDPSIPAEAEWLRAISPVENVKPANYPAVLVTAGENDRRCPTWHARTFVDLVQRAQAGEAPILLRIYGGQGHGAAGLGATADKDADWLAFAAHATGLAL